MHFLSKHHSCPKYFLLQITNKIHLTKWISKCIQTFPYTGSLLQCIMGLSVFTHSFPLWIQTTLQMDVNSAVYRLGPACILCTPLSCPTLAKTLFVNSKILIWVWLQQCFVNIIMMMVESLGESFSLSAHPACCNPVPPSSVPPHIPLSPPQPERQHTTDGGFTAASSGGADGAGLSASGAERRHAGKPETCRVTTSSFLPLFHFYSGCKRTSTRAVNVVSVWNCDF